MSNMFFKRVTGDRHAIITHDFEQQHEYEVALRAVGPDGTLQAMESAARNTIIIQGKLSSPVSSLSLAVIDGMTMLTLSWTNPPDTDFDVMEIWRSNINFRDARVKVAETRGTSWVDELGATAVTRHYWIRGNDCGDIQINAFVW